MYEIDFKTFEILIRCRGNTDYGKYSLNVLNKMFDKVSKDLGQFNISLSHIRDSKVRKIEKTAVGIYSPYDPRNCKGFLIVEGSMLQNDENAKIQLNEVFKDEENKKGNTINEKVVNLPEEDDENKKVLFVNVVKIQGFSEPFTSFVKIRFAGMEIESHVMQDKKEPAFEFKAEFPFYESYNMSSVVVILVYSSLTKWSKISLSNQYVDYVNKGFMKYIGHAVIDLKDVIRLTSENPRYINIYGNDPEYALMMNPDFSEVA